MSNSAQTCASIYHELGQRNQKQSSGLEICTAVCTVFHHQSHHHCYPDTCASTSHRCGSQRLNKLEEGTLAF